MIDLYMIRHAESTANQYPDQICGQSTDIGLTTLGVEQAQALGGVIGDSGIVPDVVYVSPARRAQLTARYCLEFAGLDVTPIVDERLHEVSQGDWEGHVRSERYTEEVQQKAQLLGNDFKAPNGESINEVRRRAFSFLDEQTVTHEDSAIIFAFGHGFITRVIAGALLGWSHEETRSYSTPNTSITHFQFDGQAWRVPFVGQPELEARFV